MEEVVIIFWLQLNKEVLTNWPWSLKSQFLNMCSLLHNGVYLKAKTRLQTWSVPELSQRMDFGSAEYSENFVTVLFVKRLYWEPSVSVIYWHRMLCNKSSETLWCWALSVYSHTFRSVYKLPGELCSMGYILRPRVTGQWHLGQVLLMAKIKAPGGASRNRCRQGSLALELHDAAVSVYIQSTSAK